MTGACDSPEWCFHVLGVDLEVWITGVLGRRGWRHADAVHVVPFDEHAATLVVDGLDGRHWLPMERRHVVADFYDWQPVE